MQTRKIREDNMINTTMVSNVQNKFFHDFATPTFVSTNMFSYLQDKWRFIFSNSLYVLYKQKT